MSGSIPGTGYDVVVVGGGGAGLAAALTAIDTGASVLLVEASSCIDGSMALSSGGFLAAGTSVQREAGFDGDTADDLFDHYTTFNQWAVEPGVVRRFVQNTAPALEWLRSLGVEFRAQDLSKFALERFPRSHAARGGAAAITKALYRACRWNGVEFAFGIRIDRLLTQSGRVIGASASGDEITAGSVVVATGGFGHDRSLLEQRFPSAVAAGGEDLWSVSAATCRGDGLKFTTSVGAETTGEDRGLIPVAPLGSRDLEPFLPSWLVFVNGEGSRFVNERAPYAVVAQSVLANGGYCCALVDERMRREAKPKARGDHGAGFWSAERILDEVAAGRAMCAETVGALAVQAGLPAARLEATIETYDDDCDRGVDRAFEKNPSNRRALREGPFYAVRMVANVVSITNYGLRIDPDGHVLGDADGRPIPGLFAAGEVTGNVMGPQYVASGNSVANAVDYGRIAGHSAAVATRRPFSVGVQQS